MLMLFVWIKINITSRRLARNHLELIKELYEDSIVVGHDEQIDTLSGRSRFHVAEWLAYSFLFEGVLDEHLKIQKLFRQERILVGVASSRKLGTNKTR